MWKHNLTFKNSKTCLSDVTVEETILFQQSNGFYHQFCPKQKLSNMITYQVPRTLTKTQSAEPTSFSDLQWIEHLNIFPGDAKVPARGPQARSLKVSYP